MNIAETLPTAIQTQLTLPLYLHSAQAGFDGPADEDEPGVDLNDLLVRRATTTFCARVRGELMRDDGLFDGDLLIVDRSLYPSHGDIVVAALDGELLCRRLDLRNSLLLAADSSAEPLSLHDSADLRIEGVVTGSVRQFR